MTRPVPLRPIPGRRRPTTPRRAVVLVTALAGILLLGAGWAGAAGWFGGSTLAGAPGGSPLSSVDGSGIAAGSASVAPATSGSPLPSPSPVPSASPPAIADARLALEARLQATLDRVRTRLNIPGVSVTILFADGTAWTGVSGLADVSTKTAVTPETSFAFASMSKTFTSAVILELIEERRLRLTDSAASLLPAGLPITIDRRITIAMLLDHTSGLADYFLNRKIDAALQRSPTRTWTAADALRYVGKRLAPPGKAWHYANTNYLLLGLIAEHVTGRPLAAEIHDRFLEPLHLDTLWYQAVDAPRDALAHGYRLVGTKPVRPVDLSDGSGIAPFRSVVTAAGGAGSMAGTSGDLARWARALYGGDVLGVQGTALLLSDFNRTIGYVPGVSYGYGVQALTIDGHPSLGHSGRLLGFRGAVRHVSLDGLTIAVLTNQSRADPATIVRSLLKVVLPPPPKPAPSPSLSPSPSPSPSPSA
jgi:D-alanyl-D-alanine carboxypeptidase